MDCGPDSFAVIGTNAVGGYLNASVDGAICAIGSEISCRRLSSAVFWMICTLVFVGEAGLGVVSASCLYWSFLSDLVDIVDSRDDTMVGSDNFPSAVLCLYM